MPTHPQTALVTGASSGIGRAVAQTLTDAGYTVIGTSRDASRATSLDGVRLIDLDVTSQASVDAAVSDVLNRHGRIDLLVNNAGLGATGAAEESSMDLDRRLFDLNVLGLMRTTKAVLPHMRNQQGGRVINISSVVGFLPSPYMAAYSATKHAVEGWSESVDHEVREFGVRVLIVQPAYTNTSFEANALRADHPLPVYAERGRTADDVIAASVRDGDPVSVVADAVITAASAANPRLRYTAGSLAGKAALLHRMAPARIFDRQIRKMNQLPA